MKLFKPNCKRFEIVIAPNKVDSLYKATSRRELEYPHALVVISNGKTLQLDYKTAEERDNDYNALIQLMEAL